MKLKAHTLVESLIALSIMAFISGATLLVLNQVRFESITNIDQVYSELTKALATGIIPENSKGVMYFLVDEQYNVSGLKMRTAEAKNHQGKVILSIRELIPQGND